MYNIIAESKSNNNTMHLLEGNRNMRVGNTETWRGWSRMEEAASDSRITIVKIVISFNMSVKSDVCSNSQTVKDSARYLNLFIMSIIFSMKVI